MPRILFDASGGKMTLGPEIGRGGEATVFELPGKPGFVAKVYHQAVDREKTDKLTAMTASYSPELARFTAWPTTVLFEQNSRTARGVILPRVTGHREIHHLYSPAHRKQDFPKADWAFLIHVARNCAAAFDSIHGAGHVVGDVNQGGVLVSPKATVALIDCDSFQITRGAKVFCCDVGVGHFTPPELQGKAFKGLHRTADHDRFGMAVLIFHLLFMGRHPFAGRFAGPGDLPIEKAIREFRFAFSAASSTRQMTPPPHSLRLAQVSQRAARLFEAAFSPDAIHSGRPPASEWIAALDSLRAELSSCARYRGHAYHRSSTSCPWCEIEKEGGPDLFISLTVAAHLASGFDLASVWAAIDRVSAPALSLPPRQAAVAHRLPPLDRRILLWGWATTASAGAAAMCAVAAALGVSQMGALVLVLALVWLSLRGASPYAKERSLRTGAEQAARSAVETIERQIAELARATAKAFGDAKGLLDHQRHEYQKLPQVFQNQLRDLESRVRDSQLRAFLGRQFLDQAQIRNIGPSRLSLLRSFGIETALDLTPQRICDVPGFGPALTGDLLSWKAAIDGKFRFDPQRGVDPADKAALLQSQAQQRSVLETELVSGARRLQTLSSTASTTYRAQTKEHTLAASRLAAARTALDQLPLPRWIA